MLQERAVQLHLSGRLLQPAVQLGVEALQILPVDINRDEKADCSP